MLTVYAESHLSHALIAGSLREGNIKTVGKTTGTAAKVFVSHKHDWDLDRKEANIAEQKKILNRYIKSGYKAFVFECMAINPLYQKYLEEKIMFSTIGVITNVREDHTDMLGVTLPEIAQNLCQTVPTNGHLVTAERNRKCLKIIRDACTARNTTLHVVSENTVSQAMINPFEHYEYKENVAIALKVAELVGIPQKTALAGMHKSLPDPGAFKLQKYRHKRQTIYWANLFAVNDRESFVKTVNELSFKVNKKAKKAIILNNRQDRPERVKQFVDIALNSFNVDYLITFGDYEKQVQKAVKSSRKRNKPTVVHLGNSTEYRGASGEVLWSKIIDALEKNDCLVVGAVNIHTEQADNLLSTNLGSLSYAQ
jgi:poly-gamma-glutamate synthase PgsB/CapB